MRRLRAAATGGEGFLLLEVLIALLLLALLLGPLVNGVLATTRRFGALKQSAAEDSTDADESALVTWSWGPGLTQAVWRPGPELVLQTSHFAGETDCKVGLWIGGWFVQEYDVGTTGLLSLGAATWCARSGEEVVIRSRMLGSTWGPPWRTEVPSVDGVVVVTAPAASAAPEGAACWALHEPSATSARPLLSWSDANGGTLNIPAPFVSGLPPAGVRQASLDSLSQIWTQEEGRELDVYY